MTREFGLKRVVEPNGSLPVAAWKMNNGRTLAPHEIRVNLKRITFERENFYQWMIVLKETGQPIGSISVVNMDDRVEKAEIGYCMGRKWWHMGIMTEALRAVMDFLFSDVGVNWIEARHDPRNPHSGGVMRKCGMKYEGTARQADRNNQGICDAAIYALLRSDLPIHDIDSARAPGL